MPIKAIVKAIFPQPVRSSLRAVAAWCRSASYIGWQRFCPVCRRYSRVFVPYGMSRRPDVGCPSCGSAERHRFAWLFLQRRTGFFQTATPSLLHIAPEPALERQFRRTPKLRYVTTDLFAPSVNVKADLTCLPFLTDTFDVVVCCNVLMHIPMDTEALHEIRRVLQPGGWMLLTVPVSGQNTREITTEVSSGWGWGALGDSVVRRYGLDIIQKLETVGFKVQPFRVEEIVRPNEQERVRIGFEEAPIFQCTKK